MADELPAPRLSDEDHVPADRAYVDLSRFPDIYQDDEPPLSFRSPVESTGPEAIKR